MRNKTNLIQGLLLYLIFLSAHLIAAPYQGKVFELRQPDGTTVQCKVYGDEFFQYVESLDGYTLIRNPQGGWIEYAQTNEDQTDFVPTGIVYHHQIAIDPNHPAFAARSKNPHNDELHRGYLTKSLRLKGTAVRHKAHQRKKEIESMNVPEPAGGLTGEESMEAAGYIQAASTTGSVVGLTILIDFSDQPAAISQTAIDNYCNQAGYAGYSNNGSVRDYFYSVSNGLLEYTNYVTPYYRAKNPKSYYEGDCTAWGKTAELILEALQWLDSPSGQNFDFRTLTRTTDNRIKCLNIFYAGSPSCGWAKGLWPHSSSYNNFTSNEGVKSGRYQMTDIGGSLDLRTFCHENGHMLCGYPDLYDYGYESYGAGNFCLMAYGGSSKNPVPPCGYLRWTTGWETVISINNDPPGTVRQHTANSNVSYKYVNPANSREYFMIESRLTNGRNASLPDDGLLIWHIDEDGDNDYQEMTAEKHYLVSLEQADGLFGLEKKNNYGGSGDCFHGGYKEAFDDYTLPDARWWSGSYSGLKIVDISPVSSTMSFSVSPRKLLANWKCNGTAQDSSGNNRHGTLINGAGFGAGVEGTGSLELDGIDDYMTISGYKGIQGADSRTCVAWIRTDWSPGQILTWGTMTTGQKWVVRVNDNGTLRAEVQDGYIYGTTSLTDNQWHHIAVVLANDGSPNVSETKLFVDGQLETIGGVLACPVDTGTDQDVHVGVFSPYAQYFKGQIDDVRIYNYALTAAEILPLVDIFPPSPNPASFWVLPFVSGAGQIAMTAASGVDSSIVQYFFEETTGHAGSNDSGWQSSPVYVDADLQQGTEYRYRVKMKDAFGNETAFSDESRLFIPPSPDIVKDNIIDLLDLSALASQWMQNNCYDAQLCQGADLNADNQVGMDDLVMLIALWLQTPDSP